MSSNFKLAATTAVLLSTLSFTATAGDDKLFADVTPKNAAVDNTWEIEALNRVDEDDSNDKRFIVGVGALDPNDTYLDKNGIPIQLVGEIGETVNILDSEHCEEPETEAEGTFVSCELTNPFIVKVFRGSSLLFRQVITEAVWDTAFPTCGSAELVLRTDNGDNFDTVQDGDKLVVQLQNAKPKKVGQGFFSEDEPAPGEPIGGCPAPEVEVEDEG